MPRSTNGRGLRSGRRAGSLRDRSAEAPGDPKVGDRGPDQDRHGEEDDEERTGRLWGTRGSGHER